MSRKFRKLKRNAPKLPPKPRLTFVCEGKNSEPKYLRALKKKIDVDWALFNFVVIGPAGVPSSIVERVLEEKRQNNAKDSFTEKDQYWAIYDRDEHPCYYEAGITCRDNGINIAASNPCIELWFILHNAEYDKVVDRKKMQKSCEEICKFSSKSGDADFAKLVESYELATDRAERKYAFRVAEKGKQLNPPYTTFFRLIRELEKLKNDN